MSEPIIVALRPQHGHREALALATHLAQLLDESVVLTTVDDSGDDWVLDQLRGEGTDRRREQELESARQLLPGDVASSTATPHAATVAAGLATVAADVGAGLIVLGASMGTAAGRLLEGDVGLALLRSAPCALLMAPRTHDAFDPERPSQLASIAVGWNPTPEAADALLIAIDLAARAGCPLTVLHVLDEATVFETPASPATEVSRRDRAIAQIRAAVCAVDASLPIVTVVSEGSAVDRLRAASARVDLLVIGSRRVGAAQHLAGTSVSEALLRKTRCPLLVIPVGARFPAVPSGATTSNMPAVA